MARVHKVILYIVDANSDYDWYSEEEVKSDVTISLNEDLDVMTKVASVDLSEPFKWDDDLIINSKKATLDDYEAYFKKEEK